MMTSEELKLYESLNFYNWYKRLILYFYCEENEMLRKPEKKEVEKILKNLNYSYTYFSDSKIYNIHTKYGGIDFYCNLEVSGGLVNVYLFAENQRTKKRIGNNLISTCRLIEIAKREDSGKYMLLPRYRSYEELQKILREIFLKYEEFKVALFKSKIIDSSNQSSSHDL